MVQVVAAERRILRVPVCSRNGAAAFRVSISISSQLGVLVG